ncbi:MAG: hypothetical protein GF411_03585 [Candidatus Lokiarchaeota archaeon]|nr:hypothetical protein [Candidatus Lokiarchaeota archaeon]
MGLKAYVKLMRPHQWYKNLLVFIALIFAGVRADQPNRMFDYLNIESLTPLILGFLAFCAISSFGYIINDIADRKEDAVHPEKRNRPIPSGEAKFSIAIILAMVLFASGLVTSYILHPLFFLMVVLYIINSQFYNFYLRNWAIVDVASIAFGFILRAVSGTFLLHVPFTSWLIVGIFFFALVLGFGKRYNELQLLGDDAADHKFVFTQYNREILQQAIGASSTWVVMFYALYTYQNFMDIMADFPVMLTVPIAAGLMLRYVYLIYSGSPVGRKPHLAFKDKGIIVGTILFAFVFFLTLYYWVPLRDFILSLFPNIEWW